MKAIPTVQQYMTYLPTTVGTEQSLAKAKEMMSELKVRHLPVLSAGKLVGLLSKRDLDFMAQFQDVDFSKSTVADAFSQDPYETSPTTPLDQVVAHMAEKKFGSAIIVDNHKVVGIFTEIDAYRALADLLHTRLKG